jgi:hypothetical protein
MNEPLTEMVRTPVQHWLDVLGKVLVLVAGLAYGAGLLIVNLFLSSHGVLGGGLLRSDYVVVGLLWLVITLVPVAMFDAAGYYWRFVRENLKERRYAVVAILAAFLTLLIVAIPTAALVLLSGGTMIPTDESFYVALIVTGAMSGAAWLLWRDLTNAAKVKRLADLLFGRLYPIALSLLIFFGAVVLYARYVYPGLDAAFGGARRRPVFIVLAPDTPTAVLRSLPRSRRLPGLAGPVVVLLETDQHILLLARPWPFEGGAIAVSKETVTALLPELP